jgi:nucleoside permease NupC
MTSGFATIAGSVLSAYIFMGVNPQALVSSCVMSIPASLAISKMRYPETEETLTSGRIVIPESDEDKPVNSLHAFSNGGWLGLKVAGMIVASLLCILSLLGLVNGILTWWGNYLDIPKFTIQLILGYLFYPIAFLLGVQREGDDLLKVSQLIGIKVIANEFVAVSPTLPHSHTPKLSHPSTSFSLSFRGRYSRPSSSQPSHRTQATRRSQTAPASSLHTHSAASAISAPSVSRSVCCRSWRRGRAAE